MSVNTDSKDEDVNEKLEDTNTNNNKESEKISDKKKKENLIEKFFFKKGKFILISFISIALILSLIMFITDKVVYKNSNIEKFESLLEKDKIGKLAITEHGRLITYSLKKSENDFKKYEVIVFQNYFDLNPDIYKDLKKKEVEIVGTSVKTDYKDALFKVVYLSIMLLFGVYILYMVFGMNKSRVEHIKKEKTRFSDVGGLGEVKKELENIIHYLNNREEMKAYVDKLPKGILFEGSPGNGKTLLARVIAGESNTPFFYISGADIEGGIVGQGAGRVRDIFKTVKNAAKEEGKAILFIDELDSVGTKREKKTVVETNQTINAILTELDGFNESDNVLVIGATNLASQLDSALIRSGRFDRIITIPLPSKKDREEILSLYLNNKKAMVCEEVYDLDYLKILAEQTQDFSGSDLSRLINDSLLLAYDDKSKVTIKHLRESYLRMVMGLPKGEIYSELDNKIVSYHEAAHAVVHMHESNLGYRGFAYGTVRPYGEAGGHVSLIESDIKFFKKSDYYKKVKVLLAGRAIEEKILDGDFTGGAQNDLSKVNNILYNYVTMSGMSENYKNLYIDKDINNLKADWIQDEINNLREKLYAETKEIINSEFKNVEMLANYFIINKDIDFNEIHEIFKEIYPEK